MSLSSREVIMKQILYTVLGLAVSALFGAARADVVVSPSIAGPAAAGTGANASFFMINDNWRGSTVAWNESTRQYGTNLSAPGFAPIGSFSWGTGLWGRADWNTINQPGTTAPIVASVNTLATSIMFGDTCYGQNPTFGAATLPLSGSATPSACPGAAAPVPFNANNWTSRFTGFIRVTDPGAYNFSVGSDDGFFFDLYGGGGTKLSIGRDFLNARTRDSFNENLVLSQGLYQFELGSWDRLEAGFVDLRWKLPGATDYTLIPAQNLVASASSVDLPGTVALGAAAGFFGWAARRRRNRV
ncbi:MAG: PEP-CTERM sorting domain-containing protein [Rubrivivax sp.]